MTLSILSVAYPFAPVGSSAVGGAEQVLTTLDTELVRLGHRSVVVARHGSETSGPLFATAVPTGPLTHEVREAVTAAHQESLDRALHFRHFDLVHMHGIDFYRYRLPRDTPALATLHLPPSWYPQSIWTLPRNVQLQCVSESQRLCCPSSIRRSLPVITNGVPVSCSDVVPRAGFALMLSRICPEKNLHIGLDAARLAGVSAILAGETFAYKEHLQYLQAEIKPRLNELSQLIPPVGGAAKQHLLDTARCLLLPTLAPETSSLVAMEALAAGTPVIAFPSGAIPEIVEHGRTGFLVRNTQEMAAAITRADQIDPAACRAAAMARFSLPRMTDGYISLYKRLVQTRPDESSRIAGSDAVGPPLLASAPAVRP